MYELDEAGFTECSWADLDLVRDWQTFFDAPERLLRHLLTTERRGHAAAPARAGRGAAAR